jgi:hypothetical protein
VLCFDHAKEALELLAGILRQQVNIYAAATVEAQQKTLAIKLRLVESREKESNTIALDDCEQQSMEKLKAIFPQKSTLDIVATAFSCLRQRERGELVRPDPHPAQIIQNLVKRLGIRWIRMRANWRWDTYFIAKTREDAELFLVTLLGEYDADIDEIEEITPEFWEDVEILEGDEGSLPQKGYAASVVAGDNDGVFDSMYHDRSWLDSLPEYLAQKTKER